MTVSKHSKSTLADVAAAAGVSRSTASRALNDSPRISESTKKRIRAVARQINFVPNAQGRALAVGRSETIAMLVTEPLGELFSDPTYGAFLGGITEQLAESAYLPILLQASSDHERERVLRHLARRSVDAVIDISPYKGSELLDTLRDLRIPTVLCGQLEGHPYRDVFSTVYSDDVEGAGLAADAMRRRGRRNLVAILGPRDNPAVVDRLLGSRGVATRPCPTTGSSTPAGARATAFWPCATCSTASTPSTVCSRVRTASRPGPSRRCASAASACRGTCRSSGSTTTPSPKASARSSPPCGSPCATRGASRRRPRCR